MSNRAVTECPPKRERFRPNGGSRRSAAKMIVAPPAAEVSEAPFAALDAEPIDAPMWPIHPAMWFQPERKPSFQTCRVGIERANRIPAPDFVRTSVQALDRPDARELPGEAALPQARPVIAESGLSLLGWDPRAVSRKEAGE